MSAASTNLSYAGMIYGLAGAVTNSIQTYYQNRAQQQALRMQASVADLNAQVSDLQAQQILFAGSRDAAKVRAAGLKTRGKAAVSLAASGVDIRGGSAMSILEESDLLSEQDADEIKRRAVGGAAGARIQGIQNRLNAQTGRTSADTFNPGLSALTTFGAQGTQVAARWYQYREKQT